MKLFLHRKILIIIFLVVTSFNCLSREKSNSGFNIGLTVEPKIEERTIPRGMTLSYINFFKNNLFWGISGRNINKGYTSIWASSGYKWDLGNNICLPFDLGIGLKIKNFDLTVDNQEGLNLFIHGKMGLWWFFDNDWSYTLSAIYNYDIFIEKNHTLYITLGMSYLF